MGTVYGYRFMTKLFDVTFFRMGSKSRINQASQQTSLRKLAWLRWGLITIVSSILPEGIYFSLKS